MPPLVQGKGSRPHPGCSPPPAGVSGRPSSCRGCTAPRPPTPAAQGGGIRAPQETPFPPTAGNHAALPAFPSAVAKPSLPSTWAQRGRKGGERAALAGMAGRRGLEVHILACVMSRRLRLRSCPATGARMGNKGQLERDGAENRLSLREEGNPGAARAGGGHAPLALSCKPVAWPGPPERCGARVILQVLTRDDWGLHTPV